jgi:serine/threonine protein kinase
MMSQCPDLDHLKLMLSGALPEQEQSALTTHLDTCPTCRQTLEDLATDGESWSVMVKALQRSPAQVGPALDQAIQQIKVRDDLTSADSAGAETLGFLSPPQQPGQLGILDHYAITGVIGRGGMGVVLKAFDSTLHRDVAIKVLAPQLATSAEARKRFLREARAAAAISHEHVVTIHAVAEANGMPYLVMQYVAGVSLQEVLDRCGALPPGEIVRIGREIAQGLAAAHARGLIHRDIKPANILLENDSGQVKITDFGLARAVDEAGLTQSGSVAGTPQYMAPEQARGEALDHRADLFSLGSVLYAMGTGRPPFRADSALAVLRHVSEETPEPIQKINPEIPAWLTALVGKLHAKEPAGRCQSAAEVAAILGQHLHELPQLGDEPLPAPHATPPPTAATILFKKPRNRSRPILWALTAVILLAPAVGLAWNEYATTSRQTEDLPKKLNAFPQERTAQIQKLITAERDKRLHVMVTGPSTFQAGAPNEYRIETRNLNNQRVPVLLTLLVRDLGSKDHRLCYEGSGMVSNGDFHFVPPPALGLKGEGDLLMEISAQGPAGQSLATQTLALRAPAYVTHLTTDRPLYRPGDLVSFRSLTLDSFSRQPPGEDLRLIFTVTNPSGQEVHHVEGPALLARRAGSADLVRGPDQKPLRGVAAGEFPLPPDAPGGDYLLTVREALERFAPQRRRFVVQAYEKPRLFKTLEFTRKSYGPGDEVVAAGRVSRMEGGRLLADQPVAATILVDGKRYGADGREDASATLPLRTDREGAVTVAFRLPANIGRGDASLSLRFTDGGNVETLVRPIPVVVNKLQVEFFPEGGDLVAGVPNRIYFQARTLLGRPADLKGHIVDRNGNLVARVQTWHDDKEVGVNQGMGSFELTPAADAGYELKIDAPASIQGRFPLPAAKPEGVVLHVPSGATVDDQVLQAVVHSVDRERELLVGVFSHGRLLAHESRICKPRAPTPFEFRPGGPGGVYRVTVFEERNIGNRLDMVPVAERLVYRRPARNLQLTLTPDKQVYLPRDKVMVTCSAADAAGQSQPAVLLVGVVDQGVLALAQERTARALPTHFLLTSEVRDAEDLEHADFLLSERPQAARALDLLLGTQGWRRFVEQPRPQQPEESLRLRVSLGQLPVRTSNRAEVEAAFLPELNEQLKIKNAELDAQYRKLEGDLDQARRRLELYRRIGSIMGLVGLGVLVLGIVIGLVVLTSVILKKAGPIAAAMTGVVGVVCFVIAVTVLIITLQTAPRIEHHASDQRAAREGSAIPRVRATEAPAMKKAGSPHESSHEPDELAFDFEREESTPTYRDDRYAQVVAANDARAVLLQGRFFPISAERRFRGSPLTELPSPPPFVVREYAHRAAEGQSQVRSDFTETLYWHPALVLADGKEFLNFDLSDAVTSYQIRALGHTLDGRLGETAVSIAARKPFHVEPHIPVEVAHTDRIDLPVIVANDSARERDVAVRVQVKNLSLSGQARQHVHLEANQRRRLVYRLEPAVVEGKAGIYVSGKSPLATDQILRPIKVVPDGFPVTSAHSDVLDQIARHEVVLPSTWIKGTLKLDLKLYPSVLADLETGLDALLREPHGCFEQASSGNYPNVLILDYLRHSHEANPALARRAQELLASGYGKLIAFECSNPAGNHREGYEWFGASPPHEALTAYGLLEFRDMSRVYEVDPAMLERTRAFLMDQRDGQGGFKRNPRALDQFGRAPDHLTNAYIVWALTESGNDDVSRELTALTQQARSQRDPYFLALVARSLLNRGQKEQAGPLLKVLAEAQDREHGFVPGAQTSIVASRGRDLLIETTALAVLAWIKANPPERLEQFRGNAQAAVKWLVRQRSGAGGFGSSQASVLALKAFTALGPAARTKAGEVRLYVEGREKARRKIEAGTRDVVSLELPDPESILRSGSNKVRVESIGGNELPYTLACSYRTLKPPSAAKCPVGLRARLDKSRAQEGDTVRLSVALENKEDQGQGMAVAVIGLPGGLTLPEDLKQLQELTRPASNGTGPGRVSFWELKGRELVLYWRQLAPRQKIAVDLDLICRVPGEYRGPASRAYLYYAADDKSWVEPLAVSIAPSGQ